MNALTLRWTERALLVIGLVLAAWSAARIVESRYVARLPIPEATRPPAPALPGDGATTATARPAPPAPPPAAAAPAPAPGSWVARLDAPSVTLSATVLEGSDDQTLGRGAGHIEGTPFPGQGGNFGIAGHRDTTFRAVRHLKLGDPIDITTTDQVYRYLITKLFVVNPDDVYVLDPGDRPMLTLVTCFPFEFIGHAPRRYIVQAVLVDQAPRASVHRAS